jgi:hypothetical protein
VTPTRTRRALGALLATASLASIAALTLRSNPALREFVASTPLTCVVCGREGALDFTLNLIFFAPLGAGLYLAGLRPLAVIMLGAALSLTVETIQFLLLVGRDASLGDLLSNSLGTALGAAVARRAFSIMPVERSAARWRLVMAVGFGCAGLALGGWALLPSTSGGRAWHARTAFEAPDGVPFRGTITEFRVGAEVVTPGVIIDAVAVRAALDSSERIVTIRGQGALVADPETWLAVLDVDGNVEVSVGQEWCAFTYLGRQRAFDLRLHEAGIFVDGPCRESLADSFDIRAEQSPSRLKLSVRDAHGERASHAPLYLATGWISFWPYADHHIPRRPGAEVSWIGLLLVPTGIWLAPAAIGMLATGLLVVASTALLLGFTAIFGLSAALPAHLAAVPLGIAAGSLVGLGWRRVIHRL